MSACENDDDSVMAAAKNPPEELVTPQESRRKTASFYRLPSSSGDQHSLPNLQGLTTAQPYLPDQVTPKPGAAEESIGVTSDGFRLRRIDTAYSQDPYSESSYYSGARQQRQSRRYGWGGRRPPTTREIFRHRHESGKTVLWEDSEEKFACQSEDEDCSNRSNGEGKLLMLLLQSIGAVGVVYGDVGTSPIYTYSSIFAEQLESGQPPDANDIVGATSNVIWVLFLVACVKYCVFVLRADYHSEGGSLAMYQLLLHRCSDTMGSFSRKILFALSCCGAGLLLGDSIITPAISVLSALEGLEAVVPSFSTNYIDLAAVVLLAALYSFQFLGTGKVGYLFGPILLLWFLSIGCLGLYNIVESAGAGEQSILAAFNPVRAVQWWVTGNYAGSTAFKAMGSVVLTVTGVEALYADMGHFGRPPIYVSWFTMVLPFLLLQYCGQGAYMLRLVGDAAASQEEIVSTLTANSIFWVSIPRNPAWIYYAELVLATLATVVASQSLITSAFTLTSQMSTLGMIPRLKVVHTSNRLKGQVYIASVNILMGISCCALILAFKKSIHLASAFGLAVSLVFFITSAILFLYVAPRIWRYPLPVVCACFVLFGCMDAVFVAANAVKFLEGAWLPLAVAVLLSSLIYLWTYGEALVLHALQIDMARFALTERRNHDGSNSSKPSECGTTTSALLSRIRSGELTRGKGIGIYLTKSQGQMPAPLLLLTLRLGVVPREVVLVDVEFSEHPFVPPGERFSLVPLCRELKVYALSIRYGWAEPLSELHLPKLLAEFSQRSLVERQSNNSLTAASEEESGGAISESFFQTLNSLTNESSDDLLTLKEDPVTFFVNNNLAGVRKSGSSSWKKRVLIHAYAFVKQNLQSRSVEVFNLPLHSTVEVSATVEC